MPLENVEAVRLAYEVAYARRSVEDVREAFSEDYVFHARPEFPGRPEYGVDEMTQLWADLDETYTEFSLVPQDFVPTGSEHVLVTVRTSTRLRGSDARIESTAYHLWHVPDGRPRRTWGYSTRAEALQAAGLRTNDS